MKATGIIRRIDDLGRVVIPKEIRRSMNINEGDPLEIYVDHEINSVIFQKYESVPHINNIEKLKKTIFEDEETMASLCDDQKIILEYHFNNISRILKGE
jgi:AbrB family transcriptional regulator (stage V sporulation protein T)